jgi:CopG family nickel-responsive transcriptional regulator
MRVTTHFNVCIDESLLRRFDMLIEQKRYINRSEATRTLIRNLLHLPEPHMEKDDVEMIGTVTLVYNYPGKAVSEKLSRHKDLHRERIVSSLQMKLDDHRSLEVLVVKGEKQTVKRIADELGRIRGIRECNLAMSPAVMS